MKKKLYSLAKRRGWSQTQRGITLIEVLISALLLSVGLLGIAGLQAAATKYKINTWSRAAVSGLFSDITNRIRINPDVAGTSFITGVPETSLYALNDTWATQQSATLTTPNPNCETAVCTPQQRATFDMTLWRQSVRNSMPRGAALINGTKRDGFNITLMWYDKDFLTADNALSASTTCTGSETGMARQNCCPAAASAPAGVRCVNFMFIP
jgi:type IV pilus assembly protein PilV